MTQEVEAPMQDEPYGPPLSCRCGCGGLIPRHRWPSQQNRFIHGHNARGTRKPIRYVEQDCGYATPCWVWQLATTSAGYGAVGITDERGRRKTYAHRLYYERANGPIPTGMDLDHLCRNRACCNPDHLEVVERRINAQRGSLAKLTRDQVDEIRAAMDAGGDALALSKQYGVSRRHVYHIAARKTWGPAGIRAKIRDAA